MSQVSAGTTTSRSRPTRGSSRTQRPTRVDAQIAQLEWTRQRLTAAAVRRDRKAQGRADFLIGGALLQVAFDGDWHGLARWLAPRLSARQRQRLSEPLPEADQMRRRRLHWVLARAGQAARATSTAHASTAALVNVVRACFRDARERAALDALLVALETTPVATSGVVSPDTL